MQAPSSWKKTVTVDAKQEAGLKLYNEALRLTIKDFFDVECGEGCNDDVRKLAMDYNLIDMDTAIVDTWLEDKLFAGNVTIAGMGHELHLGTGASRLSLLSTEADDTSITGENIVIQSQEGFSIGSQQADVAINAPQDYVTINARSLILESGGSRILKFPEAGSGPNRILATTVDANGDIELDWATLPAGSLNTWLETELQQSTGISMAMQGFNKKLIFGDTATTLLSGFEVNATAQIQVKAPAFTVTADLFNVELADGTTLYTFPASIPDVTKQMLIVADRSGTLSWMEYGRFDLEDELARGDYIIEGGGNELGIGMVGEELGDFTIYSNGDFVADFTSGQIIQYASTMVFNTSTMRVVDLTTGNTLYDFPNTAPGSAGDVIVVDTDGQSLKFQAMGPTTGTEKWTKTELAAGRPVVIESANDANTNKNANFTLGNITPPDKINMKANDEIILDSSNIVEHRGRYLNLAPRTQLRIGPLNVGYTMPLNKGVDGLVLMMENGAAKWKQINTGGGGSTTPAVEKWIGTELGDGNDVIINRPSAQNESNGPLFSIGNQYPIRQYIMKTSQQHYVISDQIKLESPDVRFEDVTTFRIGSAWDQWYAMPVSQGSVGEVLKMTGPNTASWAPEAGGGTGTGFDFLEIGGLSLSSQSIPNNLEVDHFYTGTQVNSFANIENTEGFVFRTNSTQLAAVYDKIKYKNLYVHFSYRTPGDFINPGTTYRIKVVFLVRMIAKTSTNTYSLGVIHIKTLSDTTETTWYKNDPTLETYTFNFG